MISFTSTWGSYTFKTRTPELLFDLFLDSLIHGKMGGECSLWIISPWLSDVNFSFVGRSTLNGIFLFPRKATRLSEILENFLDCGGTLKLVCRPPHDLVNIDSIRMLFYLESANFQQKDAIIYKVVDSILSHKATIDFMLNLLPYVNLRKAEIRFNEKLHAKIFVSKSCAVTGSSNMTFSGLYSNLEFNCVITDDEKINKIKQFCNEIWNKSDDLADYVSKCTDFHILLNNLESIKDKFDPRLKDLYVKLQTLKEKSQRVHDIL